MSVKKPCATCAEHRRRFKEQLKKAANKAKELAQRTTLIKQESL